MIKIYKEDKDTGYHEWCTGITTRPYNVMPDANGHLEF